MNNLNETLRSPVRREVARLIVLDQSGSVLLLSACDSTSRSSEEFWMTPGGGRDGNETLAETARREMFEETGVRIDDVGHVLFTRFATFRFENLTYEQHESYFAVQVDRFEVHPTGWTDLEKRSMTGWQWWRPGDLETANIRFYPQALPKLIRTLPVVCTPRYAYLDTCDDRFQDEAQAQAKSR